MRPITLSVMKRELPIFASNVPGWSMIALAYLWTAPERVHAGRAVLSAQTCGSYVFNNWQVTSEKAKRELDFKPISFQEGARRTLAWYREMGIWKPRRDKHQVEI